MKFSESVLIKALKEFDERLYEIGAKPFDLNTVGGFALLLNEIRPCTESSQYTDIDYVGDDFSREIKDIVNEIGAKYHLGRNWINRDVVMDDLDEEDLEYATGELHFDKSMELSVITVYSLRKEDLIRMKVIAIDTAYMEWQDLGGEFSRFKDFGDVKLLMEDLGWDINKLRNETEFYVYNPETYTLIKNFSKKPAVTVEELV